MQEHQQWRYDGNSPTLTASMGMGGGYTPIVEQEINDDVIEKDDNEHPDIYVQLSDNCKVYAIWYEKYQCYIAIRKLTPLECFRLQGFSDEYFEKAQFVNSDSQLYRQAGNAVTVSVVYEIAKAIANTEVIKDDVQMS